MGMKSSILVFRDFIFGVIWLTIGVQLLVWGIGDILIELIVIRYKSSSVTGVITLPMLAIGITLLYRFKKSKIWFNSNRNKKKFLLLLTIILIIYPSLWFLKKSYSVSVKWNKKLEAEHLRTQK